MEFSTLPLPDIRDDGLQYSFKRASQRRGQRRPPKLNVRYHHDANFNRSHSSASNTALAISFCTEGSSQMMSTTETSGFEESFTALEKIGEGSFGEVFKVRSKADGHLYAVKMSKQLFRSEHYRQEQLEEARRCEQFSGNENCVRFYRAWEQDDRLYMQMELCRESLDQYLERRQHIPESKIWTILLDLLLALKSLHDRNLIHLDIKLDNVLVGDDDTCKLADFGLVIDVDRAQRHEATEGDSRYMAPEILQGQFTKAADVFSLGIAMLELSCYMELPTNGPLWQQLRSGTLPEEFVQNLSPALLNIIKQMMTPNAHERPTVDQLLAHRKFVDLLKQRQRWSIVKLIKNNISKTYRYATSKSCQLKSIILKCITYILAGVLPAWRNNLSIAPPKLLNGHVEQLPPAPDMPRPFATLLYTPKVHITASTPTTGDGRPRNNHNLLGESSMLDLSQQGTPHNISSNHVVNSTPLNRYESSSSSMRSRKDLTRTSFRIEWASDMAEPKTDCNGDVSTGNILRLEDVENQASSFIRKPLDSSSIVAKSLFSQYSSSEDSD